ncbi:MAG TPA: hypothetical protein VFO26_10585 [Gaiella sp.]|uniref:hypothetical protein n=1 Tax=Gaiella sp. TaxID=2663207 RepID=UPI002D8057C4|nr:hypothetical protein [Gaiella sp.]HET9287996.1 hypothetical protein [Gaiella sp.]
MFGLFYVAGAGAVHDDGVFELDRNAVDGPSPGEDWNKVCPAGTPVGVAPGCLGGTTAGVSRFVTDAVNAAGKDTTLFTGGATKDDLDVTGWQHTTGAGPDKDDLSHGYAARYGDLLYFGADRYSASGDSTIGIWFFQAEVAPVAGGTFSGAHTNGDVLVLSDFTKGGEVTTIRVFEWHSPGGEIDGTLDLIAGTLDPPTPADCVGPPQVGGGDEACATVNIGDEDSPWDYEAKEQSATPDVFPKGHFYEGGIDLAQLGLADECFSSFIIETRASQSVDAVLKDFVGGAFAPCNATLSTTPSTGAGGSVQPGVSVTDTATVLGQGISNPPTPTGSVTFFLCGPIATGTCTTGGTTVSTNTLADSSPPVGEAQATSDAVNTAGSPLTPGRYCFRAEWPGDTNYPPDLVHSGTGDSECFSVTDTTTTSTAQNWRPNDSATVTATGGSALAGSVQFTLYPGGSCTGTALYSETVPVSGTGSATVSTTNDGSSGTDVLISTTGTTTVSWLAVFTSTNSVQGSTGPCETTTLTISNG